MSRALPWRVIRAGAHYGGLAFVAGIVLDIVRQLLLAPRLGGLPAALLVAVFLAVLLPFAARSTVPAMPGWRDHAVVAAVALGVVLLAGTALEAGLRGSGLLPTRPSRPLAEQAVALPLLAWLAALPFLVRRR